MNIFLVENGGYVLKMIFKHRYFIITLFVVFSIIFLLFTISSQKNYSRVYAINYADKNFSFNDTVTITTLFLNAALDQYQDGISKEEITIYSEDDIIKIRLSGASKAVIHAAFEKDGPDLLNLLKNTALDYYNYKKTYIPMDKLSMTQLSSTNFTIRIDALDQKINRINSWNDRLITIENDVNLYIYRLLSIFVSFVFCSIASIYLMESYSFGQNRKKDANV